MAGNPTKQTLRRQALLKRWFVLWLITAALVLYPINNLPIRIALLLCYTTLWTGLLYFYWHKKFVRFGVLACTGIAVLFLILPGKHPNTIELRRQYLANLSGYEGTKYVWGGENWLGIDCSGLLRSGLIVADYQQGFLTLNPRLIREGFSLWWHDCSAKALGEEYRQQTRLLFPAPSVNEIGDSIILPGDLAVTTDGVHTLTYLGNQIWIEADPTKGRVIKEKVPTKNPWFDVPVNVLRWSQFD